MKNEKLPGMRRVEIRCKLPEFKRDQINIISSVRKITVSDMLEQCIDNIISHSDELKALSRQ